MSIMAVGLLALTGLLIPLVFFLRGLLALREVGRALQRPSAVTTDEPAGTLDDVKRLALEGKKIEAIRLFRDLHDCDLKQAKEAVEEFLRTNNLPVTPEAPPPDVQEALLREPEFQELLRAGRKLDAISLYRERTHVGLLEAKQAVERAEKELPPR